MLKLRQYCFTSDIGITSELKVEKLLLKWKKVEGPNKRGERRQHLSTRVRVEFRLDCHGSDLSSEQLFHFLLLNYLLMCRIRMWNQICSLWHRFDMVRFIFYLLFVQIRFALLVFPNNTSKFLQPCSGRKEEFVFWLFIWIPPSRGQPSTVAFLCFQLCSLHFLLRVLKRSLGS